MLGGGGLRTKRTRGNNTCFIWTTVKAWSGDLEVVAGMKGKDKSCDLRNISVQGGEIILVCFGVHKGSFSGKTQRTWTDQRRQLEQGVRSEMAPGTEEPWSSWEQALPL